MSWQYAARGSRDLRIDFLRGLAMICVIVDHSRLSSMLSWFSYERFWTVTAAEVFLVLSGVVIGTVYGQRLRRGEWRAVVRGLTRRAAMLYAVFVSVTLSVVVLGLAGVDVSVLTTETLVLRHLDAAAWRDILLMRAGPWAFQIVGLYVWLVAAAIPCLLAIRVGGWRLVIAASWMLYLWHHAAPHPLTPGAFELTFPIRAWQLLFVHGLVVGYHREQLKACAARCRRPALAAAACASAVFVVFALCNPWTEGPELLHWNVVSPERFSELYFQYFSLSDLGIGRLLNLAVALPLGYVALTWCWRLASPLASVLVTLGQHSLGAFVLHVYTLLLLARLPPEWADALWLNTLVQLAAILAIAAMLKAARSYRVGQSPTIGRQLSTSIIG